MIVILADSVRSDFFMGDINGSMSSSSETPLNDADKSKVREVLAQVKAFCARMHLPVAGGRIDIFQDYALRQKNCSGKAVWDECIALMDAIEKELAERKLVFIHPSLAWYLEREKPFGDMVFEKFPSAREEIKDASNSLAVGLDTAVVFHLMRVVEIGLRAMARHMKVPIAKEELQYWQWQNILEQIKANIPRKTAGLKGKKRAAALEFYNGITAQIEGFKDEFRNNVMHSRTRYNGHKAWGGVFECKSLHGKTGGQTERVNLYSFGRRGGMPEYPFLFLP